VEEEAAGMFSEPLSMYMAWVGVEGWGNAKWRDYSEKWNWRLRRRRVTLNSELRLYIVVGTE
jgi:hypothetical protein